MEKKNEIIQVVEIKTTKKTKSTQRVAHLVEKEVRSFSSYYKELRSAQASKLDDNNLPVAGQFVNLATILSKVARNEQAVEMVNRYFKRDKTITKKLFPMLLRLQTQREWARKYPSASLLINLFKRLVRLTEPQFEALSLNLVDNYQEVKAVKLSSDLTLLKAKEAKAAAAAAKAREKEAAKKEAAKAKAATKKRTVKK